MIQGTCLDQGWGSLREVAPVSLAGIRLQKVGSAIGDLRSCMRCVSYLLGPTPTCYGTAHWDPCLCG